MHRQWRLSQQTRVIRAEHGTAASNSGDPGSFTRAPTLVDDALGASHRPGHAAGSETPSASVVASSSEPLNGWGHVVVLIGVIEPFDLAEEVLGGEGEGVVSVLQGACHGQRP
jgi:hypothetical protein